MGKLKPVLIKKGAEADLYLTDWHHRSVVMKKRLRKKYRPLMLDEQIRKYRTVHEPQLMHEAKKAGVPTPIIFLVDLKNTTIVMEFVEGKQVKQLLSDMTKSERRDLCLEIGKLVGKLHAHGIIHGDLTTSNMIRSSEGKIFFVDFGLGERTKELEPRGVDLHLLKRALQSIHFNFTDECFDAVIAGYTEILDREEAIDILNKISEIERRGRYVAERKVEQEW
jgi:TP53 regulating kinase-like protein